MVSRKKKALDDRRRYVVAILLTLLAFVLLVALASQTSTDNRRVLGEANPTVHPFDINYDNQAGMFGAYLSSYFSLLLGWLAYFIPVGILIVVARILLVNLPLRLVLNGAVAFLFALTGSILFDVHVVSSVPRPVEAAAYSGGLLGKGLTILVVQLTGEVGAYLTLSAIFLIFLALFTSFFVVLREYLSSKSFAKVRTGAASLAQSDWPRKMFEWVKEAWIRRPVTSQPDHEESEVPDQFHDHLSEEVEQLAQADVFEGTVYAAPDDTAGKKSKAKKRTVLIKGGESTTHEVEYTFPGLELLTEPSHAGPSITPDELALNARMLKETLETFGVAVEGPIQSHPGPVITRFEFKPAAGVKVNQIVNLSDDLALALKARRIRIIAPIPGKAAVGVEIPNRQAQTVYLRQVLQSGEYQNQSIRLPLALGLTTSGAPFVADLTKAPHLLIAGATGSGKSVCMNTLITSLIYRLHPQQVRFIFIDPKMLELSIYAGIPHLSRPVITESKRAEKVLNDMVVEMENRYRRLATVSVRNIEDYNRKQTTESEKLPYIVVFVDELADLMMSSQSAKTELLITRLAQMSRAVGIHLILATQRPSVDVITGLIKANFPARIAFQVSSKVDSRTILDANGAEKLLGMGDMLFLAAGQPEPIRIHGAYVTSEETEQLVTHLKAQTLPLAETGGNALAEDDGEEGSIDFGDPLFREACEVVVRHKQGSVSLLQRRLGIGYQRAARLIDKLEEAGIVSPFDGSKAREVVVDKAHIDMLFAGRRAAPLTSGEKN